jgi:hypothetical protein
MSTHTVIFPSASTQSKLSACPTTKIPQAADWIFQDFFDAMMDSNQVPSIQVSELFPQEKYFPGVYSDECPDLDSSMSEEEEEEEEEDYSTWINVAPVLIESNISSYTTESTKVKPYCQSLKKKRSTSSFSSLKSFMSVFNNSKKTKLYHPTIASPQKLSMTATISRKVLKYFKRRLE